VLVKNALKLDPSHTKFLRDSFEKQIRKVYAAIEKEILSEISGGAFRLGMPATVFESHATRVKQFKTWLEKLLDDAFMRTDATGNPWWVDYVNRGYKSGVLRAYHESRREILDPTAQLVLGDTGLLSFPFSLHGPASYADALLKQRKILRRLEMLREGIEHNFADIASSLSSQSGRIVIDALHRNVAPRTLARTLAANLERSLKKRGIPLSHAEVVRFHADGELDGFENLGADRLRLDVEWKTMEDPCPKCAAMAGEVFPIEEARGVIPLHPQCRCSWVLAS
jgi:hypothetical protein